jgi:RND superfamily putative drug exporter
MFAAVGRFAYRRRYLVVILWSLAFLAGLLGTLSLPAQLKGGGFTRPESPSQEGQREMQKRLGFGPARLTVVFASDRLDARSPAFRAHVDDALAVIDAQHFPGLISVQTAASTGDPDLISRDGAATFAVLEFNASMEQVQGQVEGIRQALRPADLTTYLTGDSAVYAELEQKSADDLRTVEGYTLPVAVFVLLLIFGTLVAASLPVICGAMAVSITLGVFWLLAQVMDLSVFAMNVATLLGLVVGIDYALFMVGRFREELGADRPVEDAVERTVRFAGRSIFFSGLTVVVGLLGLISIPFMSLRSMGIGGGLVVLVSVLAALTLLPALLGVLGARVNALRIVGRSGREGTFWRRWSDWVMRRPVPVLLLTVALMVMVAWPATRLATEVPSATSLPQDSEARQGYEILQSRFDTSALSPIEALVTWKGGSDPFAPENLQRLFAYGQRLEALPGVARVVSIVNVSGMESAADVAAFWKGVERGPPIRAGRPQPGLPSIVQVLMEAEARKRAVRLREVTTAPGTTLFRVVSETPPTARESQGLATQILESGAPPGAELRVAGVSMAVHDFLSVLAGRFPWIILFVVCLTALVLLVLLRSVVLPIKAVVMNMLSLLAGYGAMVWVFQEGHLEWLFGFSSTGAIDAELPVLLFCTVFGVSMDYEVFLLTRMREAWDETGDNREAVRRGLAKTGRIVTSAALIVVVVASSFAFTSILITKAIGVGLAVAVLLDATVIRILMVPAAMRLIGRWNWWLPEWLGRHLPRIE